ncbi:MAG: type 4a pilus biogenesis protein PilO [Candidatus Omnitrophota bacterium]|nr:MAG: type 4a pilus biogenesis protein PilO [Candidatus Omnitrophota bacterium]
MINIKSLQDLFVRLSKREKIVFYGAIISVFFALLFRLIIFPFLSKRESQNEEIKNKKIVIQKDLRLLALKDIIVKESQKYKELFSQKFSPEEQMTSTLKEIENLANEAGIYIVYIRPGETKTEKFFQYYLVNLSCEGEMSQIVGFFHSIEVSNTLLTIERYTIAPKSEGSRIAQCRMTISKMVLP